MGKGPEYERATCKRLSLWVSDMTRKDCFWRSAMSGGRNTVARKQGSKHDAHAGDIVCTHPLGQPLVDLFVLECKFYKDLKTHKFFFGYRPEILQWWEKLLDECDGRRQPLLIMKQNHIGELLFTSERGLRWLRWAGNPKPRAIIMHPRENMYVFGLSSLFCLRWKLIKRASAYAQRLAIRRIRNRPRLIRRSK